MKEKTRREKRREEFRILEFVLETVGDERERAHDKSRWLHEKDNHDDAAGFAQRGKINMNDLLLIIVHRPNNWAPAR